MINELLKRYPVLEAIKDDIQKAADMMLDTYLDGGKILVCGNGGSCSDSEHIVGELMKGFLKKRKLTSEQIAKFEGLCDSPADFASNLQNAVPAISLSSQSAIFTAFINDVKPDMVYAQMTYGYGKEKDLLIGISTSGNSSNVVNAVIVAKSKKMKTLCMTGMAESKLSEKCDCSIRVPETETYKIQELHLPIYHYLCAYLESKVWGV